MNPNPVSDPFDFDSLQPHYQPFNYAGKSYVIREASEGASVQYQNRRAECMVGGEGGQSITLRNVGHLEPLLVILCLFEVVTDDKGNATERPVPRETLLKWPSRVVGKLYKWVLEHSDMEDDDSEESLTKEIHRLTQRLEKVRSKHRAAQAGDDDPNAATAVTTDTGST